MNGNQDDDEDDEEQSDNQDNILDFELKPSVV